MFVPFALTLLPSVCASAGKHSAQWALDDVLIGMNDSSRTGFHDKFDGTTPLRHNWYRIQGGEVTVDCLSLDTALTFNSEAIDSESKTHRLFTRRQVWRGGLDRCNTSDTSNTSAAASTIISKWLLSRRKLDTHSLQLQLFFWRAQNSYSVILLESIWISVTFSCRAGSVVTGHTDRLKANQPFTLAMPGC